MSPGKSTRQLLIIEGDARLVETLHQHFQADDYQVHTALSGEVGLKLAVTVCPDLILLDARMPDMAGLEVFRMLRDKPRTAHIPVMVLAGRDDALLQHKVLEEGAYDFIEKPLDLDILTLRVRNALRRAEREGLTEPRTGLPTGRLIQERLNALAHESGWTKIEVKIDSFGVFRDLYGFVTANEALSFAGNLIAQIVHEYGSPDDFVGHLTGTEEFVIVTTLDHEAKLCEVLGRRVTQELESFYSFVEREQAYVLVEDGAGGTVQKPLMSAQARSAHSTSDTRPRSTPRSDDVEDIWVDAVEDDELPPDDVSSGPAFEW